MRRFAVTDTGRLFALSRAEAVNVGALVLADGRRISVKAEARKPEFLRFVLSFKLLRPEMSPDERAELTARCDAVDSY